jgi:hypothetical protein
MFHKSVSSIFWFVFLGATLFLFLGCETSDINNQESVTSGTSTGSGSSGGAAANVSVTPGNNPIASGATTTITVIITDAAGRRTDASFILTSSHGGTFNGTNTTLSGGTLGGFFSTTYTYSGAITEEVNTEITATVSGTTLKGSTFITITPVTTTSTP